MRPLDKRYGPGRIAAEFHPSRFPGTNDYKSPARLVPAPGFFVLSAQLTLGQSIPPWAR
jgi:hypothetical protein